MRVSEQEFRFMVEGITSDLIQLLMDREQYTLPQAVETVYSSSIYLALQRPSSGLYAQSSGYVYEYLQKELKSKASPLTSWVSTQLLFRRSYKNNKIQILLSKMSIAYKEADETDFWLNLLHDNGYLNDEQFNSLNKDIDRILKVLASIVKTMKEKIEAGKKK